MRIQVPQPKTSSGISATYAFCGRRRDIARQKTHENQSASSGDGWPVQHEIRHGLQPRSLIWRLQITRKCTKTFLNSCERWPGVELALTLRKSGRSCSDLKRDTKFVSSGKSGVPKLSLKNSQTDFFACKESLQFAIFANL